MRYPEILSCPGTRALQAALLIATLSLIWPLSVTGTEWQPTNGPYGGDVVDLAVDGSGNIYVARGDDIFRSDDGGASWINVSEGKVHASIHCLFVTPGGDIYAGVSSRGVFWSFDGGGSWDNDQITHDPHGGLGATILAIGVNANDVIFAGSFRSVDNGNSWLELGFYGYAFALDAAGDIYAGSQEGVRYSDDEGATWEHRNTGMEEERVRALALNSQGHLLAGTWAAGVFLSTDEGASWTPVNSGLPSLSIEAIAIDGDDRIYLALYDGGFFQSNDSGASWQSLQDGLAGREVLSVETGPGDLAWAGSKYHGVYRSDDQGATWTVRAAATMGMPGFEDLAVSAPTGDVYLAADGGGIYRSANSGIDWQESSDGLPTTRAHAVASDSAGRLYAGTAEGVFASADGGATWQPANAGHEGIPAIGLLIDGDDNVIVILAESIFSFTFSVLRSTDGGTSWQEILNDKNATLPTTAEAWAIDAEDRLYIGGMSMATESIIFSSEDDGATWHQTTIQFTTGTTGLAVEASGKVYATMGNNDLYASVDHGQTWFEIPNGGWPTGTSRVLDVIGIDSQDAVLVSSRHSGIWRSSDGGATWASYDQGLPSGDFPEVTFLNPAAGYLFAGTLTDGLFRRAPDLTAVEPSQVPGVSLQVTVAPNPFNPLATIQYTLAESGPVDLAIHDVRGRLVRSLVAGQWQAAGTHEAIWDGRDGSGRAAPSGVFFATVQAGREPRSVKMIMVR